MSLTNGTHLQVHCRDKFSPVVHILFVKTWNAKCTLNVAYWVSVQLIEDNVKAYLILYIIKSRKTGIHNTRIGWHDNTKDKSHYWKEVCLVCCPKENHSHHCQVTTKNASSYKDLGQIPPFWMRRWSDSIFWYCNKNSTWQSMYRVNINRQVYFLFEINTPGWKGIQTVTIYMMSQGNTNHH